MLLRRGDNGPAVRHVQQALADLGFDVAVDGIFGRGTEQAVEQFQANQGLIADGVVGPNTLDALGLSALSGPDFDPLPEEEFEGDAPATLMLSEGQSGPAVRQLQQDLTAAGFPCGEIDGVFGAATVEAVLAFQRSQGLIDDGIVGPETSAALQLVLAGMPSGDFSDLPAGDDFGGGTDDFPVDEDLEGDVGIDESDFDLEDSELPSIPTTFPEYFNNWDGEPAQKYREHIYFHKKSGKWLDWPGRPAPVDLADRTHICVHQTDVEFGTGPARRRVWLQRIKNGELSASTLEQHGYDEADPMACTRRLALHERFWKIAYHWVGLRNGDILFNNAPSRYTYHGNRSNSFALGVSGEGKLPGLESERDDSHTTVDERFIETNRQMLRLAITTARDLGAPITHATAHRCFSMTRMDDPGEAYWKEVVIPVCAELAVTIDYDLVKGGRPIPRDWDPSSPYDWRGNRIS